MISDQELHRRLTGLPVEWPSEVDLSRAVGDRIGVSRSRFVRRASWRLAAVAMVMVAVALSVALVAPGPRAAIARLLGFPGIAVETTNDPLPEVTGMDLGRETTLEALRVRGWDLRTLPLPERGVFVDERRGAVHIGYRLATGDPLLLTQLRDAEEPVFLKQSPDVIRTEVDGQFALWVTGNGHALLMADGVRGHGRLADNSLLWSSDNVTYRLEADIGLSEAVRLAEDLR